MEVSIEELLMIVGQKEVENQLLKKRIKELEENAKDANPGDESGAENQ